MTSRLRSLRLLFPAAALFAVAGPASAATTWLVHVGRGGTHFVDDVSGTSTTTIQAGDTVQWVWEGTMSHSVTSGSCPDDNGGGGGGGYGSTTPAGAAYGGGTCTPGTAWTSTGLQSAGFMFSDTFPSAGVFKYYCAMHESAMTGKVVVLPAAASNGPCVVSPTQLCLNGGRFAVTAEWARTDGTSGHGTAISLTDDSGYFWFFDSSNIEVTLKVLNGCALDNAYWVFAAGLTNVDVQLRVVDTTTGAVYTRENPQSTPFAPIQDTAAFPASCP